VPQVILNPSDEPYFNVVSTMSNKEDVQVGVWARVVETVEVGRGAALAVD
jgi:hypothetical protein